jgi:hypothetical protein
MAEAVRFYWQAGEACLPLSALPEGDRNPLQVRRSVVKSNAPDVIKQLEAGRFVAAAWESDGQIRMILCHPNVAKGPADNLCVDTRALPRLVLTLSGWEEVPAASKLLLTAFGSEAADESDCEAARRTLAKWFGEHGQPEMTAVAKRFSRFPFGVRSDSIEIIRVWRRVLVQGEKEKIDRFLTEVEQRFLAHGWSRELEREARMNKDDRQINHIYCWVDGHDTGPRVMLCLNHATAQRVRGGTYDVFDRKTTLSDLAGAIQHALKEVLEPAAAAAGLEVLYAHIGPISRIGHKTAAALTDLAEAGDGQWPLSEQVEPLWRKLVHTAYRDEVAIHPEELTAWFVASGWSQDAAIELTKRFYSDVALIEEYEEAGRQPA